MKNMKEYLCGLHHIGLPTNNMDATIAFYRNLGGDIAFEKMDEEAGKPIRVVHLLLSNLKIEVYERDETAGIPGAIDHIAIQVKDIEAAFKQAQEMRLVFMDERIGNSTYWPDSLRWFILIGPNGEKVEFEQS